MKIIIICLIFSVIVNINTRLLTEASCSLSYVYYPLTTPADNTPVIYSNTSEGIQSVSQSSQVNPWPIQTYTTRVETAPFVVYYLRKGNQSWRVSVLDDAHSKEFKVKGEKFLKDKSGETWYTHDKIDDNFKAPFARCQALNRELKSRKSLRTKTFENKVVNELPDLLEKISVNEVKSNFDKNVNTPVQMIKSVPIVNNKSEAKNTNESTKKVTNAVTAPVKENKKPEAVKVEAKLADKKAQVSVIVKKENITDLKVDSKSNTNNTPVTSDKTKNDITIEQNRKATIPANTPSTLVENKKTIPVASQTRFMQKLKGNEVNLDDESDLEKFEGDSMIPVETPKAEQHSENKALVEKAEDDKDSEDDVLKDSADDEDDDEEDGAKEDEDKSEDTDDDEAPEENNELADDEKAMDNSEDDDTESLMDMEEQHDQEEMEGQLIHDLNPYGESNPDLL